MLNANHAIRTEIELKSIDELHPILLAEKEVVVLDIETTGFSLSTHAEIIEIGAVRLDIERQQVLKKFHTKIRPSNSFSIPEPITNITGITWSDVCDAPYIEDVLPSFASFIGNLPIVAHNAVFDWCRFLVPMFEMVGLRMHNPAICTMKLAKYLYPNRAKNEYNLASLCEMYGHPITGHHHALTDSLYTASIFLKMISAYRTSFADRTPYIMHSENRLDKSTVWSENFAHLKISKISCFKGQSKRHGPSIYVNTNFGRLCYSVRRHQWTCVQLFSPKNVPVAEWGQAVLSILNQDIDAFVKKYVSESVA